MRKYNVLFLFFLALISFSNCSKNKNIKEYYVISEHESRYFKGDVPPPPPPPPGLGFYSNLVIVFDSIDKVYLYQTIAKQNLENEFDWSKEFQTVKFPSYIGLYPNHLLTFTCESFIQFIKNNDDILELDTMFHKHIRFFYIASSDDTIKSKAFYDLIGMIKPQSKNYYNRYTCYNVRKTTEEERKVIYYKRRQIQYNPEKIGWSDDFLLGNCRPFTRSYDSIEKKMNFKIEAFGTLSEECTIIKNVIQ